MAVLLMYAILVVLQVESLLIKVIEDGHAVDCVRQQTRHPDRSLQPNKSNAGPVLTD